MFGHLSLYPSIFEKSHLWRYPIPLQLSTSLLVVTPCGYLTTICNNTKGTLHHYTLHLSATLSRIGYPTLFSYTFHITLSHKSVVYLTSHSYLSSAYPHSVNQELLPCRVTTEEILINGLVIYISSSGTEVSQHYESFLKSGDFVFSSHTPHSLNTLSHLGETTVGCRILESGYLILGYLIGY